MVIVIGSVTNREDSRITTDSVHQVITDRLDEAARVTTLGHV